MAYVCFALILKMHRRGIVSAPDSHNDAVERAGLRKRLNLLQSVSSRKLNKIGARRINQRSSRVVSREAIVNRSICAHSVRRTIICPDSKNSASHLRDVRGINANLRSDAALLNSNQMDAGLVTQQDR